MKNLKLITTSVLISAVLLSCQKEAVENAAGNSSEESEITASNGIDAVTAKKMWAIGVNPNTVESYDQKNPDGSITKAWIDGDLIIPEDHLSEIENPPTDEIEAKAYRFRGILSTPKKGVRNLELVAENFSNKQFNILKQAINSINSLNLKIKFKARKLKSKKIRLNGRDFFEPEAVNGRNQLLVKAVRGLEFLGTAYRPKNGNPQKRIQIRKNIGNNTFRGTLLHEIMHSVGIVHSDFRTGSSCPKGNRARRDQNAIDGFPWHIPGTSKDGNFKNSIMTTCYRGKYNLTGEDKKALRSLYKR
ncbi:M57 family metalloprotease [Aquimarina agarilytica]|uniref:M57 family metalloprotease n=1 Tax=Aquimarina agarilytica TaxID=1087449 RepID=UPI0002884D91|nr:M57 family metalloprotease [Aquimarina agarilytica]